ncbi:hypothetical protein [Flavobacterium sp.]|uniref:hypothetical protein n=1 Tax=Flavobacterium sp. TaxID=239 RepID=UPI00260A51C4|nr:hypothetical protein [Flavobacterium sp.]
MRYLYLVKVILLTMLFVGCSSDESNQSQENFLTINGVKQSLTNQAGVNIYFNGGGFTFAPQTGNTVTVYDMVNIIDPDQIYLPNFNSPDFSNSLHLRFITAAETNSGNHTTVNGSLIEINSNDVIAECFTNDETQSVYAQENQKIFIEKSPNIILIKFTNVRFGTNVMSGRFKINY